MSGRAAGRECEEKTESEPAASRTCCERVRVCRGDTCRRDTSDPSGQQLQRNQREVATPFFFLGLFGELCVSGVEASSDRIELFKLSVCRVRRL